MIILALKTDKPESELWLFDDDKNLAHLSWEAHRRLAGTIHKKIKQLLDQQQMSLDNLGGAALFKGPGSFTGLRIGASVANALAYSRQIPIIAKSGEKWLEEAVADLLAGKDDRVVVPEYGAPAATTQPRK